MDKSASFSTSVVWAALIISGALVFSASTISPKVGRYTITPERQNWVIVGDTKTGRSWSCVTKALYESEDWQPDAAFPKNFEGCLEMSVPSAVQKRVAYENN